MIVPLNIENLAEIEQDSGNMLVLKGMMKVRRMLDDNITAVISMMENGSVMEQLKCDAFKSVTNKVLSGLDLDIADAIESMTEN